MNNTLTLQFSTSEHGVYRFGQFVIVQNDDVTFELKVKHENGSVEPLEHFDCMHEAVEAIVRAYEDMGGVSSPE